MTDRKLTCVACKSAVTHGDIEHRDLEFGGVLKATNQPEYTADADTDLVATVGTLDEYTPMVRTSGNQNIIGVKNINSFFSYRIRLTSTDVYELFRTTLTTDIQVYYTAFSRYGLGIGKLSIILDADGNVSSMATDKVLSAGSNDGITTFYAYKDGTELVVCVGNETSYNNYLAITINSLMSGAGVLRDADISNIGTLRTATSINAKVLQ